MLYLAEIVRNVPLTVHFSLCNPSEASEPAYAPRLLGPLGYFVKIEISDGNQISYLTHQPKADFKLRPDRSESYLALEPGYTHGIVFVLEEFKPSPGYYQLILSYSNREYEGCPNAPVGELFFRTELPVHIDSGDS